MLVRLTTLCPAVWAAQTITVICRRCVKGVMRVSPPLRGTPLRHVNVLRVSAPKGDTLEGDSVDIEDGNKSVARIVDTTRAALKKYRMAGWNDEQFVTQLLGEFIRLRSQMSSDAGSLHMALSIYNLALMADYIEELEKKVDFHKSAVEFLLELDEFESI
jgi:hypothetical protein